MFGGYQFGGPRFGDGFFNSVVDAFTDFFSNPSASVAGFTTNTSGKTSNSPEAVLFESDGQLAGFENNPIL